MTANRNVHTHKALEKIHFSDGIYYPNTIDDLKTLIRFSKENHYQIRTIGSGHSPGPAIYGNENTQQIKINLGGDFRKIHSIIPSETKEDAIVKVGAGCNLGINPSDARSTQENSFNYQVDQKGYALPTLGGISHQTIAGFLQTSSSGGTTMHNIADVVEEIEFIDGTGEIHCLTKADQELNAVAVSMGLFGIITSVTFKLPKKYNVEGKEENKEYVDSFLVKDEHGQHTALRDALLNNEYIHINYLPQKGVNRTMQWTGRAVSADKEIIPYKHTLRSKFITGIVDVILFVTSVMDKYDNQFLEYLKAKMLKAFVNPKDHQEFCDVWYQALPIDDQTDVDQCMKLLFSEIWFPFDQIDDVMNALEELFNTNSQAAGNFVVEFYCAKESPFWLSPSHGGNAFRVDLYWWYKNVGKPEQYFGIFWDKLLSIPGARLHWGKYLPIPGEKYGDKIFTAEDLYHTYPKFSEWKKLRDQYDPHQLFVTDYWRKVFDIPLKQENSLERKQTSSQESYFYSTLKYLGLYKDAGHVEQQSFISQVNLNIKQP